MVRRPGSAIMHAIGDPRGARMLQDFLNQEFLRNRVADYAVFLAVLALAGLFDQWVDFRKIHKRAGR